MRFISIIALALELSIAAGLLARPARRCATARRGAVDAARRAADTRRRALIDGAEDEEGEVWDDRGRREVITTRSYIPPGTLRLFDGTRAPTDYEQKLVDVPPDLARFVNPRTVVIAVSFLAYPLFAFLLDMVPPPNKVEGGYFFSLISIVFGTLTASTISDATNRLAALRAAAVEECTLMLPLLRRLRVVLVEDGRSPEHVAAYEAVARLLWAHSEQGLVRGSREVELKTMAKGEDALGRATVELQRAQGRWRELDLSFALAGVDRVVEARGVRLSLENSGIPRAQFRVLRALSLSLVVAYTYLTLDRGGPPPHVLGFDAAGLDPSFGVHVLFAFVTGALAVFNSLAADFDRPFQGAFKLESGTVVATLRQLRALVADAHEGVDGPPRVGGPL